MPQRWVACSALPVKRKRIDEARIEVAKYELRHKLPSGSLLGGESAGAAPKALSAGGQPTEMPAPPPPVGPPPDAGKTPAGKTVMG